MTVLPDADGLRVVQCAGEFDLLLTVNDTCDLRLEGPLPRQLARLLTLTGTDQILTIENAPTGPPQD